MCQIIGWGSFAFILGIFEAMINSGAFRAMISSIVIASTMILITHIERNIIVKFKWLELDIIKVVSRVLLISLAGGLLIQAILIPFSWLIDLIAPIDINEQTINSANIGKGIEFVLGSLTYMFLLIVWAVFYYLGHFIENFRKEELKNLQWEAKISEIELNKLKSQLNPHFMFNSMNGIRALIDEDPGKAKQSVTKLSNILRNTLVMNKKKVIPFEEELQLVYDYLDVESIRLEERLKTHFNVSPASSNYFIPPLILQTLVENSIKHGISTLAKGGELYLSAKTENDKLKIIIKNSGKLKDGYNSVYNSFGLANTKQRLNLLYGDESSFHICNNSEGLVEATLIIPKNTNLPMI